jgi:hypothetical protein
VPPVAEAEESRHLPPHPQPAVVRLLPAREEPLLGQRRQGVGKLPTPLPHRPPWVRGGERGW